jgi:hypothetical protein
MICFLPLSGRLAGDGVHCSQCIDRAPRCSSCGLPIFDFLRRVAGEPGDYCSHCATEGMICAVCGIPTRTPTLRDGKWICSQCDQVLVTSRLDFDKMFADTVLRMEQLLGLKLQRVPGLQIVAAASIDPERVAHDVPRNELGGVFTRESGGSTMIDLVAPLTEARARAILAHEVAHAWQSENCPENQGLRIREGFAEWVSWKVIQGLPDCDRECAKILARSDDYGQGFRIFRGLEERHGMAAAIRYACAARASMKEN